MWESVPLAAGTLDFKRPDDDARAELGSQFALAFAFQRRRLAPEMADVVSYDLCESLKARIIAAFMKPPPPGFSAVTLDQVFEADHVAWTLLAEAAVDGIKRQCADRPCDLAMPGVLKSYEFTMAIMPRMFAVGARASSPAQPARASLPGPTAPPAAAAGSGSNARRKS